MNDLVFVKIISLTIVFHLTGGKPLAPKKVAILGGGAASCTAALALTGQPGWKERYDITIYQLGWRLGGKARSGRNKDFGHRTEEITLHLLGGNYHNTINLLRSVYEELERPEGSPMRTFEEAFLLKSMAFGQHLNFSAIENQEQCFSLNHIMDNLVRYTVEGSQLLAKTLNLSHPDIDEDVSGDLLQNTDLIKAKMNLIKKWITKITKEIKMESAEKELLSTADIAVTTVIGIMDDNIFESGFDSLNHLDLREWYRIHGASPNALKSAFLKAQYDLVVSDTGGHIDQPSIEAGTALKFYLQLYLCYDDSPFFNQQSALGDRIFAPFYEVLRKRGVTFKFFHKVEELNLDENNPNLIEQIKITKQVDLIHEQYSPLITVKGLPSWPNEPKYEEITKEQAKLLQKHDIDLESFWTLWPSIFEDTFNKPLPHIVLERGKDFDIVISGLPVGSIPHVGSELLEVSPALRDTVQHVGRIPSLQVQLYLDVPREKIKAPYYNRLFDPEETYYVLGYADPNLLYEDWESQGAHPQICQYITFIKTVEEIPYNCRQNNKQFAISNSEIVLKRAWPKAYLNDHFNWNLLTDPENRTGVERFDAQFWQCNLNPSDLYTQVLTNTSKYRITTDGAGFNNIYFTGDWIQNGLNLGMVEGAVTSGLLTSKAISGYPEQIFWENYISNEN